MVKFLNKHLNIYQKELINLDFKDSHYIKEILDFHLPRFDELPNIDLYMDQVLSIIENSLNIFSSENEENIITKSMINNYVKQNVIEKPFKKRYKRFVGEVDCDNTENKLIEDNIHNKILVASIRAFSNKVYVQKLIEFNEEEQKETLFKE